MADYPYGLSADLTPEQQAALEHTTVPLGHGRSRTAADLVVGWAAHVTRLLAERDRRLADGDVWNAHDYVAALVVRGFAERALDQLDPPLRTAATAAVARFDAELVTATEPDQRGLLRRFAPDAGAQWWWQRIPRTGPVREDLLTFATRLGI
jgi:hypothetical protein